MKLNKECVRDILIKCESLLKMNNDGTMNTINSNDLKEALQNYDIATLKYTVLKMKEANLLNVTVVKADGSIILEFLITDITYYGHEFLENIKEDNNWTKIKDIAKKVGASSISAITQIAIGVITNQINNYIQ